MDFSFTSEQESIRQLAREFARDRIAPLVQTYDREEHLPRELVREAGKLGLTGGVVPIEYGGAGLDYVTMTLVVEEISKVCHVMGTLVSFPSGLAGSGLLLYGTEEQKQQYLAPLARGEIMAGAGVTEPGSGTDVAGMQTRVRKDGGDYVLSGSKMWISNLLDASWFITFAQMDPTLKHRGISAFVVPADTPGVEVHPVKNKTGFRPLATGELVLNDVRIPKEQLVGEEGGGFKVAMCAVENGRLGVAARAVGVLQASLDEALGYARQRETFGQPIGKYQLVQSHITDIALALETSRLLTYKLAWIKDQGNVRARLASSMAKLHASDQLMQATLKAAQIFGAYACSDEFPVSRY
ncbi:MAG TPA: acyl-CoA dehydrogenase family protein, partial [Chloroflexota bacterium]|nr:acyl-CoA dehydrogenase family protein [Chloroflexota bacterium]